MTDRTLSKCKSPFIKGTIENNKLTNHRQEQRFAALDKDLYPKHTNNFYKTARKRQASQFQMAKDRNNYANTSDAHLPGKPLSHQGNTVEVKAPWCFLEWLNYNDQ